MTVAVVTDSTSDLPPELAEELGIEIIPAVIVIDGQEHLDGPELSRTDFYRRLPEMAVPPTTAAPASGAFEDLYRRLLATRYDSVLSIHLAGQLSGILNAAHSAAQAVGPQIHVHDSGQVTLGLGFQVIAAAEAARQGGSLEQILEAVGQERANLRLVAMLDTLEYLRRSGRVSWARANLGSFLRIKLFVELRDGEVLRLAQVRTWRRGFDRMLADLEAVGPLSRLAVLHTNAERRALDLLESYSLEIEHDPLVVNITSVIGTHVGPNALGYVAVKKR